MQKLCLLAEMSGLWPVANTKTKKEKNEKPLKLAILEKNDFLFQIVSTPHAKK